jgi:hypothetical protein
MRKVSVPLIKGMLHEPEKSALFIKKGSNFSKKSVKKGIF